jgi:hypothetical protein
MHTLTLSLPLYFTDCSVEVNEGCDHMHEPPCGDLFLIRSPLSRQDSVYIMRGLGGFSSMISGES